MKSKLSLVGAIVGTLLVLAVAAGTVASLAGGLNPKQLFAQRAEQRNANVPASLAAKQKSEQQPAPVSSKATRVAGIQDVQQGPVPSSQFAVNNQWHGPSGNSSNTWWDVYAGSKGQPDGSPGAPALYVDSSAPTSDGYSFLTAHLGIFTAPNADSSLTIIAVNGAVLDLKTQSGRVYHFNLATDTYN